LNATKQIVNSPADSATRVSLTRDDYAAYLQMLNQLGPPGTGGPPPQIGNRFFVSPPLGETRYVKNEVVLYIPANIPPAELRAMMGRIRLTVLDTENLRVLGVTAYRVRIGKGSTVSSVIQALSTSRIVAGAQANYIYSLTQDGVPAAAPTLARTREGDAAQWVVDKLDVTDIHQLTKGTDIKIAVIDSEIDEKNPELDGTIKEDYDAVGHREPPDPHGTGMAGAIAAHSSLMGIAPSAQLYAVHAFSRAGDTADGTTFNILRGLDHAVAKGVRVINMSFAGPRSDTSMERMLHAAHDKGIVLIAAAGNNGPKSRPDYPGAHPDVIAVTATDINDKVFVGANRGRYIAFAAPGVDILVPAPEGAFQFTTGTSVAAAEVSGIVALLLERYPDLAPDDVRRILSSTARHPGTKDRDNDYGAGLVDPTKAIKSATEIRPSASGLQPAPATRVAGQSSR
jgi:subtilisin family serine protease